MTTLKKGDHVIPLYTPECRQCKSCLSRKTNLCTAIRATQGKGLMPDGTSRFSLERQAACHHYMGCSTFANYTVLPEIALAKIREDAPFDKVCYIGCGVTTGIGAVINTAKVEAGRERRGVRPGRHRPQRGAGRAHGRRQHDRRRRPQSGARGAGAQVRHDALRQPEGRQGRSRRRTWSSSPAAAPTTASSASATSSVMRQALECCHRGWGVSVIIGVAGAGQEITTRPFQLVTGRVWKGTAFGGARGPHRRAEDRRLVHGAARSTSTT